MQNWIARGQDVVSRTRNQNSNIVATFFDPKNGLLVEIACSPPLDGASPNSGVIGGATGPSAEPHGHAGLRDAVKNPNTRGRHPEKVLKLFSWP